MTRNGHRTMVGSTGDLPKQKTLLHPYTFKNLTL